MDSCIDRIGFASVQLENGRNAVKCGGLGPEALVYFVEAANAACGACLANQSACTTEMIQDAAILAGTCLGNAGMCLPIDQDSLRQECAVAAIHWLVIGHGSNPTRARALIAKQLLVLAASLAEAGREIAAERTCICSTLVCPSTQTSLLARAEEAMKAFGVSVADSRHGAVAVASTFAEEGSDRSPSVPIGRAPWQSDMLRLSVLPTTLPNTFARRVLATREDQNRLASSAEGLEALHNLKHHINATTTTADPCISWWRARVRLGNEFGLWRRAGLARWRLNAKCVTSSSDSVPIRLRPSVQEILLSLEAGRDVDEFLENIKTGLLRCTSPSSDSIAIGVSGQATIELAVSSTIPGVEDMTHHCVLLLGAQAEGHWTDDHAPECLWLAMPLLVECSSASSGSETATLSSRDKSEPACAASVPDTDAKAAADVSTAAADVSTAAADAAAMATLAGYPSQTMPWVEAVAAGDSACRVVWLPGSHTSIALMEGGTDIEARVWDAGVLVARLIAGDADADSGLAAVSAVVQGALKGKLVIDVGAGTGIAGIACAVSACAKAVALTDLPCAMARLAQNAELNNLESDMTVSCGTTPTICRTLAWGDESALLSTVAAMAPSIAKTAAFPHTVLLLADVVYEPEGFEPLASTLQQALSAGAEAILVYRHRRTEAVDFFNKIASAGVLVTLVAGDDEVRAVTTPAGTELADVASMSLRSHAMSIYRLHMIQADST